MAVKSAQQALDNWKAAMASPQTSANYTRGIQGTQVNPMEMAAQRVNEYQAGVMAAVQSGKWQAGLRGTPVEYWKTNAAQIGAPRLASGAQKAQGKYQRFVTKFAPVWAQMRDAARAVQGPRGMATATARWQAAMAPLMAAAGRS